MPERSHLGRPFRTVRWRITLLATVLVGVSLTVAAIVLVGSVERRLTDRAKEDASSVLDTAAGELESGQSIEKISSVLPAGRPFLEVFGPDGRVVRSASGDPSSQLFARDRDGQLVAVAALSASRYVVVTKTVAVGGGEYTLVAASSLDEVRRSVQTLASSLWIGIPLLVALVGFVTWWLVGRALRPVERMRREVEDISLTTLHRRLDEPDTGDEVARLAHTMNVMLDRLEAAQAKQRRFVSDASHELRSPLATIRTTVEVASLHPARADWPALASTVLGESERLDELVSDLLALAKLDETSNGATPTRTPVDLDDLVLADVDRLRALGTSVRADGLSAARVLGDAGQLARLVRNLCDNAARHATSSVTVTLSELGGDAVLAVDDDGPGVPVADRQRVFERFARLDEGRSRPAGGAGLGLSLVKAIALRHGGDVVVLDAPGGGARFEVRIPLATAETPAQLEVVDGP